MENAGKPLSSTGRTEVTLHLTAAEFVVLDLILRRFSDEDRLSVEDTSERQVLYNLQCLCEKQFGNWQLPDLDSAKQELAGNMQE